MAFFKKFNKNRHPFAILGSAFVIPQGTVHVKSAAMTAALT